MSCGRTSSSRFDRAVSPSAVIVRYAFRVNRVTLTARRELLLFPDQRTSPTGRARSEKCSHERTVPLVLLQQREPRGSSLDPQCKILLKLLEFASLVGTE